jgi:hypothetical protein
VPSMTWPSSDPLHGVKDANDAAFAAIIAHIPREDWLSGAGESCCNGHGERQAAARERFGRALKSCADLADTGSVKARPMGTVDHRPWPLYKELVGLLLRAPA